MAKFRIIERVTSYRYCDIDTDSFESAEYIYNHFPNEVLSYTSWKVRENESADLDEIVNLDTREHLLF